MVAASLKRAWNRGGAVGDRRFRDLLVAASLKLFGNGSANGGSCGFRDLLVAASLKHGDAVSHEESASLFPRSIGRGLIEASRCRPPDVKTISSFRDLLVAASLKHQQSSLLLDADDFRFRDLLVAASLKPYCYCGKWAVSGCFRDLLVAASLKHQVEIHIGIVIGLFPRSIGRGLIEATIHPEPHSWQARVSAIYWSRPH